MAETFITILAAHLLGDFIFQTEWMVQRKRHVGVLLFHVAIVTILSWLFLGTFHLPIITAIFVSHLGMDAIKKHWLKDDSFKPFLIDQSVHLTVITILAFFYSGVVKNGWWVRGLDPEFTGWYFAALALLSGLILIIPAGGIMIGKATGSFVEEIGEDLRGLKKGGKYIGWLERFLVMLLLFINQPAGIGFLITAKSILRFGEIRDARQRKIAEYIIIGTFLSFGWALLISALTRKAIKYFLP